MRLKNVIIQSIGSANPSIGKALSELLEIDQQIIAKLLYCTPSVLAKEVDEEVAQKIENIFSQSGLIITVQNSEEPLPPMPQLFDIAVHIDDIKRFPEVNKALSEFLSCTEQESLKLLLTDPSIVLGGVSFATAEALKNKINAEVLVSDPQTDLYTLFIMGDDKKLLNDINLIIKNTSIQIEPNQKVFENIDYRTSQIIWSRFQQTGKIQMMNQSFQRFEILLLDCDIENSEQQNCLLNVVGMPENILYILPDNMPVVLDESVDRIMLMDKMEIYTKAGLTCSYHPLLFQNYKVVIHKNPNPERTMEIVKLFFPEETNKTIKEEWISPKATNHLLSRYIVHLLEDAGCEVEIQKMD